MAIIIATGNEHAFCAMNDPLSLDTSDRNAHMRVNAYATPLGNSRRHYSRFKERILPGPLNLEQSRRHCWALPKLRRYRDGSYNGCRIAGEIPWETV